MGKRAIIKLSPADDYGVYIPGRRGPFDTSLVFRGTLDACLAGDYSGWQREQVRG